MASNLEVTWEKIFEGSGDLVEDTGGVLLGTEGPVKRRPGDTLLSGRYGTSTWTAWPSPLLLRFTRLSSKEPVESYPSRQCFQKGEEGRELLVQTKMEP